MALTGVLVRLPDEVIAEIDRRAGAGQRARWIRGVLEDALKGALIPERPVGGEAVVEKPVVLPERVQPRRVERPKYEASPDGPRFRRPDDEVVWKSLRQKRGSVKDLAARLGWFQSRVDRSISSLLAGGYVSVREGSVEAVE